MADTSKLIKEYLATFERANPGSELPIITYDRGWFNFRDGILLSHHRRDDIVRMTENLAVRAAKHDAAKAKLDEDDLAYLESGLIE